MGRAVKLTKARSLCLKYYRDNEHNPNRVSRSDAGWTMRQTNYCLDRDWLKVGSGGWHVLTPAGLSALTSKEQNNG